MYRVLLVDDELEIRTGLKLKIDWPGLGYTIAGEAQDGREALALLEAEARCDLILTDIRMPVMSGLELLKQCAENYPRTKVVVLSGYDDFHFVKAALQCGAKDYLLKPVVRSELTALLGKLREELETERAALASGDSARLALSESRSVLREQLLLEWIGGDDESRVPALRNEAKRLAMDGWLNDGAVLQIVGAEYRLPAGRLGERAEGSGLFRSAFRMLCRETLETFDWSDTAFVFCHRGYPQMAHAIVSSPNEEEAGRRMEALGKRLQANVNRYLKVEAVIGVGEPFRGTAGLRQGFLSALLAWSESRPGAVSQIVTAGEGREELGDWLPEAEKRLASALDNADAAAFAATVEAAIAADGRPMRDVAFFVLRVVLLADQVARRHRLVIPEAREWLLADAAWRHGASAEAIPYLNGIAARVIEGIRASRTTGGASAVEAARDYIDRSYMNEIGLTQLADRFHLNPTYLSELFKKTTGSTFSDYVTQVRLGKAAELLGDPQMRLADIAELVGFANASYLSSVFKKHYGVSPNEYRQHIASPADR